MPQSPVEQSEVHRRIAARNAVIQILMRELYGCPDEAERSVREFQELTEDGDPIACAIANVLTDAEIEQALTAPSVAHATHGEALRALPVYPYLTPEQRKLARLMRVAKDAMEEAPSAANADPGCEVMKALVGDLAERRGAKPKTNVTFQEIVEVHPEPWRRQVRKALATLEDRSVGA